LLDRLHAIDRVIDLNTGLTAQSLDPAGNTTSYIWDALGRLKQISPDSPEVPTKIEYTDLHETHVRQDLSGSNRVESVYFYDDLGRLISTKRRNASGSFDVQKTEYDIAGRVTRKSEWAPDSVGAPVYWTTYDYTMYTDPDPLPGISPKHADPLGRIHAVTTPDDLTPETPTTVTVYNGNTTTVTVRDIRGWNLGADALVTSTTVYTKDALGRLISVDSPADGADAQYLYDESDNLIEVRLTDPTPPVPQAPLHVQIRRFDYDRIGRLRTATNPENGTVVYTSYDARGNLLSYKDARQNIFKMTYDMADRLVTRKQTVATADLLLAENFYDEGTGSAGRLIQQDSYKIDNGASLLVSRVRFGFGSFNSSSPCPDITGSYTGLNGRLSWQKSTIAGWDAELQTDYCEDLLGMPTVLSYPDVSGSGRMRSRVMSGYSNGYLRQLGDQGRNLSYIWNVNYGAGGVPVEIDRPMSSDFMELDIRNRPRRFRAEGHAFNVPPNSLGFTPSLPHHYPFLTVGCVPSSVEKEKRRNLLLSKQVPHNEDGGLRRARSYHDEG
jgi:YD repeat-containing protein